MGGLRALLLFIATCRSAEDGGNSLNLTAHLKETPGSLQFARELRVGERGQCWSPGVHGSEKSDKWVV